MYTSLVFIALTGTLAASSFNEDLAWQKDYLQARTVGQTEKKPLAVFVGTGASGYEKVCKEGKLSTEVQKTLADSYICVYVDSSTSAGKKLAEEFGITRGMGLVLSDRTGQLQAFSHDGDLSTADLSKWVAYGADPSLNVTTTMTTARLSMYPPSSSGMMTGTGYIINGQYQYVSGNVIYGSSCPNGNCGGSVSIFRR